ncbi:MAG: hypothetical protein ABSE41_07135 [Bacteroidota bacterium]|jgi:predicted DNA-binding protein YlxM (UPF0122 family)
MSAKMTDEQVMELYGEKSVNEIAKELGVSKTAVLNRAKKLGITRRENRKKVLEEVQRRQGEEIIKRMDEFGPQLNGWMLELQQHMADYQVMIQVLKDKSETEANKPRPNNDRVCRYFDQIRRVIRAEGKTLDQILVLFSAFVESKNSWEELSSLLSVDGMLTLIDFQKKPGGDAGITPKKSEGSL